MLTTSRILRLFVVAAVFSGLVFTPSHGLHVSSTRKPTQTRRCDRWPIVIRHIVENELRYGDGVFNDDEVRLLLAAVQHESTTSNQHREMLKHLALEVFASVPMSVEDPQLKESLRLFGSDNHTLYSELLLNRIDPSHEIGSDARPIIEEAKAVALDPYKAAVTFPSESLYLVLRENHRSEVIKALLSRYDLRNVVLDALFFSKLTDDQIEFVVGNEIDSDDSIDFFRLSACIHLAMRGDPVVGKAQFDRILQKLNIHTVLPDGRTAVRLRTHSAESRVYQMVRMYDPYLDLKIRYEEAAQNEHVVTFFEKVEKRSDVVEAKAWLLFRYHPDMFWPLFDRLEASEHIAVGENDETAQLLAKTLRYARYAGSPMIECSRIREKLRTAETVREKVNFLVVLAGCLDDNIAEIEKCAYEDSIVSWTAHNREHSGPLVGLTAVRTLYRIGTPAAIRALKQISAAENVHQKVRGLAQHMTSSSK